MEHLEPARIRRVTVVNLPKRETPKGVIVPKYVSHARGLCRATGGMAHGVKECTDARGRKYWADDVSGKRVVFERSIAQRTRDHEAKVYRRVSNLCAKAHKTGLTANEFETLSYLAQEDCFDRDYSMKRRIAQVIGGDRFDAGYIVTRK
jgi:hypothetical protein